jgi:hypothetical protein
MVGVPHEKPAASDRPGGEQRGKQPASRIAHANDFKGIQKQFDGHLRHHSFPPRGAEMNEGSARDSALSPAAAGEHTAFCRLSSRPPT